jgi:hypothetical protein
MKDLAGNQPGEPLRQASPVTQAKARRRGQGEDSIYWDAAKNRYVGAISPRLPRRRQARPAEGHRAHQG